MHKIDEKITKAYLNEIKFDNVAALDALHPEKSLSALGILDFCSWIKTHEGWQYWHYQFGHGLSKEARIKISDMILVSMDLTVEGAAELFGKNQ